jgi:hypothetical protein
VPRSKKQTPAKKATAAPPVEPPDASGGPRRPDPRLVNEHSAATWSVDESHVDPDSYEDEAPLASRPRDRLLWLWPVVGLAGLAVASHLFDAAGTLAFGVALTGVLLLYAGADSFRRGLHTWIGAAILLTLTAVLAAWAVGLVPGPATIPAPWARDPRNVVVAGAHLGEQTFIRADLAGIAAPGVHLEKAVLDHSDLAGADLRGGYLRGIRLHGGNLRGADLRGADLRDADLTGACLVGADLTGAFLDKADVTGAAVRGTIVTPAQTKSATRWPAADPPDLPACRAPT